MPRLAQADTSGQFTEPTAAVPRDLALGLLWGPSSGLFMRKLRFPTPGTTAQFPPCCAFQQRKQSVLSQGPFLQVRLCWQPQPGGGKRKVPETHFLFLFSFLFLSSLE